VEAHCGRAPAAARRLEAMSARTDPASIAFGYQLARSLPGFTRSAWQDRLRAASSRAGTNAAGGAAWPLMLRGLLQSEVGDNAGAAETLKSVFLLPDRNLAHHHSRAALAGLR